MDLRHLRELIERDLNAPGISDLQISAWVDGLYAELAGCTLADLLAWQAQRYLIER